MSDAFSQSRKKNARKLTVFKIIFITTRSVIHFPHYRVHYGSKTVVYMLCVYWNPFFSTMSSYIMAEIINLKHIESAVTTIEQSAMVRRTPLLKNVGKIFGFADKFKLHLKMENMQNTGERRREAKSLSFRFLVC